MGSEILDRRRAGTTLDMKMPWKRVFRIIIVIMVSAFCAGVLLCALDFCNIFHLEIRSTRKLYRDCLGADIPAEATDLSRKWRPELRQLIIEFKLPREVLDRFMSRLPKGFGRSQE